MNKCFILLMISFFLPLILGSSFTLKESFHDHSYRPILNPRNTYLRMS